MGGSLSSLGSNIASLTPHSLKGLVKSAGLPLEVDDSFSSSELHEPKKPPPPSSHTEPYSAEGFFTGVRSTVTIQRSPSVVYDSLSKDLHHVFSPITECEDTVEKDDHTGAEQLFRIVRIPFRVACVSGNLKMRLRVNQDRRTRKIHFDSLKEGRLIKHFIATFDIVGDDAGKSSTVNLDARISAAQLPPPPFKSLVKAIMISKIDNCMLDLVAYHEKAVADEKEGRGQKPWTNIIARAGSSLRRSLDLNSHRVGSGELDSPRAADLSQEDKVASESSPAAVKKTDKSAALEKTDKLAMTSRGPKLAN